VRLFTQDAKRDALKRSPLFEGLSRKELTELAKLTDDMDGAPGTVLCEEGRVGREFFVIMEGQVDITQRGKRIGTLGTGDFLGEIALLEDVPRTATAIARSSLRFFVMTRQSFQRLLDANPQVERKVLRALAKRLAATSGDGSL
jgi:CRP/FNR family cyclic AMP-dependent transcriptional regulator